LYFDTYVACLYVFLSFSVNVLNNFKIFPMHCVVMLVVVLFSYMITFAQTAPFERALTTTNLSCQGYLGTKADSGSYIVFGAGMDSTSINWDYCGDPGIALGKFDSTGKNIWKRFYRTLPDDISYFKPVEIRRVSDGNFIAIANRHNETVPHSNYWSVLSIFKFDPLGNLLWTKYTNFYGGSFTTTYSLEETDDKKLIIGLNRGMVSVRSAHIVIDLQGNLIEKRCYKSNLNYTTEKMRKLLDGSFVCLSNGYTSSASIFNDVIVTKIDNAYHPVWNKSYGTTTHELAKDIYATYDSGFVVVGECVVGPATINAFLLKADKAGNIEWIRSYGGTSTQSAMTVRSTDDMGYILSLGDGSILKTDSVGNVLWSRSYQGGIKSAEQDAGGGYLLFGNYGSMYMVRTDTAGATICSQNTFSRSSSALSFVETSLALPSEDTAMPLILDKELPVVTSIGTLLFSCGLSSTDVKGPIGKTAFSFYPNPSNGQITIEATQQGLMMLTDIQGRKLASRIIKNGKNEIALPDLDDGIYLLTFTSVDLKTTITKRMVYYR
jgi:hypothetical protein